MHTVGGLDAGRRWPNEMIDRPEDEDWRAFVFRHIIWGDYMHPRVCLKFPLDHKWQNKADPYKIEPIPKGTFLFVPNHPDQDYDLITSFTLRNWKTLPELHDLHLPMMDLDFCGQFRYEKIKHEDDYTPIRFQISGLQDCWANEFQFPELLTNKNPSQNKDIGLMFVSGSGNFHFYNNSGPCKYGFNQMLEKIAEENEGWAWASSQNGFLALRPPFKPKMVNGKVRSDVWKENLHLRIQYQYSTIASWRGVPIDSILGWWYLNDEDFKTACRKAKFVSIDGKPFQEKRLSNVQKMMLEEAERIKERANARVG